MPRVTWEGSLHQSFRLMPSVSPSRTRTPNLEVFLTAEGQSQQEVLVRLPYDAARSVTDSTTPDPRRYRDAKHIYQTLGLLYEGSDGRITVTQFGIAVRRWLDRLTPGNAPVLGRHAASALAGCQLRNPSRAGSDYAQFVEVFPYAFLWRAMLALGGRISSDEMNRALFRVTNEDELNECISIIRKSREQGDAEFLGEETITVVNKNDRIIPWVAVGSFGWTLISDKSEDDERTWYRVRSNCVGLLRDAARVRHKHCDFESVPDYVEHIARLAAVPPDLR